MAISRTTEQEVARDGFRKELLAKQFNRHFYDQGVLQYDLLVECAYSILGYSGKVIPEKKQPWMTSCTARGEAIFDEMLTAFISASNDESETDLLVSLLLHEISSKVSLLLALDYQRKHLMQLA